MRNLFDLTRGMIGKNAIAVFHRSKSPPSVIPLGWAIPPPTTLKVNVAGTGTLKGGVFPIHVTVTGGSDENGDPIFLQDVNISADADRTIEIKADGTNQKPGVYNWKATDKNGVSITAVTTITA